MFRYKTYKKSILMTALAILLCLVSLTGATLALFTSDPDDGTIGVVATAGDIEVDIVDIDDKNSLKGQSLLFMTTSGMQNSNKILFEPGATFHTQGFKVKNVGNIPVKFTLTVSKDDKIDMKEFNEAFDVWIVEENTDGTKNFDDAKKIMEFSGSLTVENKNDENEGHLSKTYYLYIKMKETVGNEFQGKSYSGIGVTVYAVQANGEFSN